MRLDLVGKVFGRLLVLEDAGKTLESGTSVSIWKTRCECGTEKLVIGRHLTAGWVKSCGCLKRKPPQPPSIPKGMYYCGGCKTTKAENDFYRLKSSPTGRYYLCKECYKAKGRSPKHPTGSTRATRRKWERTLRRTALDHYGGKCACCGEDMYQFLAIVRTEDVSQKHKKSRRAPLPYWLKKNGFPQGFRVLCHNCNMALGRYGYCPHARAEQIEGDPQNVWGI
jgi:hypothetical protein